ncbi:MAG: dephospho-CoA kinase [Syntrophobacteraceae bacterium]
MREKRIALTGGIATGKSTAAQRFRELGAIILDADVYARRAVEPGTESWKALRELLGAGYFHADGTLKRRELREKIIRDPASRAKLEAVLHPFILSAMWGEWERQKNLHPDSLIIFDIPLLFEGGFDKSFDIVILVYAPPEVQVERLIHRDGLTREEAQRTLSIQYPIESKRAISNYIIDNSGDLDRALLRIDEIWTDLTQ